MGYVGLPLAKSFAKKYEVFGFDIDKNKIQNLKKKKEFKKINFLDKLLSSVANIYIVCVPTPIDKNNKPNLSPITEATKIIGKVIKKNDYVIYESTVYPGLTEEFCIPMICKISGLKENQINFGYSPERINPGDKNKTFENINKVVSAKNSMVSKFFSKLYSSVIKKKIYVAKNIKVAEASKVLENIQRDLNIALMNEMSMVCNKLNIETMDVINAARTKWNFNYYKPGLVGGHCIGVDPYYLAQKSKKIGYDTKLILSGRKLNNSMSKEVVDRISLFLKKRNQKLVNKKILILGATFKENCDDIRNSKIFDVIKILKKNNNNINLCEPLLNEMKNINSIKNIEFDKLPKSYYDVIIISVAHKFFIKKGINKIKKFGKNKSVMFDVTNSFKSVLIDLKL